MAASASRLVLTMNIKLGQSLLNQAILDRNQAKIAELRAQLDQDQRQYAVEDAEATRVDALSKARDDALMDIEDCLKFRPDWTPDQPTVAQGQPAPSPQPEIKPELPPDVPPVTLVPMEPKKRGLK